MRFTYRLPRFLCWSFVRAYFGWRVFSSERAPLEGSLLLAANHQSFIDPVVIGSAIDREIHYLAREPAFRFPVWGRILRHVNAIPLNLEGRASAGIRTSVDVLRNGNALVLFPEGTRTFTGEMQPFRSGIGLIAVKSEAPVLPIRLFGLYEAYGRHLAFPRPRRIAIKVGHPLHFDDKVAEAKTASKARLKEIYQEVTDEIERAIAALSPDQDS